MDVTASASTEVTTLIETRFIALTSTKFSVQTYGGLLGRINDYSMLTGYVDHVAFILWKGEVCIRYIDDVDLFIIHALNITEAFSFVCYMTHRH